MGLEMRVFPEVREWLWEQTLTDMLVRGTEVMRRRKLRVARKTGMKVPSVSAGTLVATLKSQ